METAVGRGAKIASVYVTLAADLGVFQNHVDSAFLRPVGDKSILTCPRCRYLSLAAAAEHREINSWNCWTSESFADAADASPTRSVSEMLRQTSPKAASGSTGFAMLPSAHRKPERRDSKAFKMETQFNTGRAWFLSVALLLGTLGFVLVDHSSRTANLRGHLHAKHARPRPSARSR